MIVQGKRPTRGAELVSNRAGSDFDRRVPVSVSNGANYILALKSANNVLISPLAFKVSVVASVILLQS